MSGESENPSEGTGEQLGWDHDALSEGLADLLSQKLASPERRQTAAAVDLTVVFGLTFAFQAAVAPPNWGFFIALCVIWFLVEVPPIAFWGRSIGHRLCSTRVVVLEWSSDESLTWWRWPGWRRAFLRWLLLVPGVVANRFGGRCAHDGWSGTFVFVEPLGSPEQRDVDLPTGRWLTRAQELDRLSRVQPRRYRARVAVVAALGYVFILGLATIQLVGAVVVVVLIVRGSIHGLGAFTWPFVLLAYGFKALSSLWISRSVPPGTALTAAAAPRLTDVVDELRTRLRAPKVHLLILDSSANAGVIQQPRFGPFGPYRNVLLVGLPLLQALPVEELRAVLAHELAHLVRRHGRFGAWIYRLRKAYPELLDRLDNEGWTATIVRVFFERYTPYFVICSLALARAHEYEADRLAGEISTPAAVAAALRRCTLLERFLAEQSGTVISTSDAAQGNQEQAEAAWEELLDTHPSDARRLAALGTPQQRLPSVGTSAATALLPTNLDTRREATTGLSATSVQAFAAFAESRQ